MADNAQIQSLLYRQGLFGIGQNGIGVVRRDMLGNAAFVKSITKPKPAMVSCGCNYGGQTFELQYNGIPIGLVTYAEGSSFASYGYVNPEDPTLFSFASAFGCDGFTTYGPVLAGLAQAMKRCALEQFDSIAKALRQIASWIVASTSALAVSLGSKMKFWAKSFLANAINAVEFAETLLSTLRVVLAWPEIVAAAIGAAVGLTVWDLVNFVWCSTHA